MGFLSGLYSAEAIRPFFDRTKSRGPDDTRIEQVGAGLLCFHRLSIMGLDERGMQPFSRGLNKVVCNGELYGWRAQRKALEAKGYSFAKAAQAFFALSSSVKIPNTADPVPVITAPTAPLFISLFLISAMGFIRLSDTSSNTLYIRLHTCARFPSFMASRIPAVSG
jgi:hypothetical protein